MLLSLVPVALAEEIVGGAETAEAVAPVETAEPAPVETETKSEASAPAALGGAAETTNVAKIGDKEYATLAAAVAEAKDGDTIMLLTDVTEDVTIPAGKNITLDLNNMTLSNTNNGKATLSVEGTAVVKNGTITGGTGYYNIEVKTGGRLTLENVTATAGNNDSSMIDNWGTLTIKSGDYSGGLNVVKSEPGATLLITGGTFALNYAVAWSYTGVVLSYGDLTITGGIFNQNAATPAKAYPTVVVTAKDKENDSTPHTKITGGVFNNAHSSDSAKIFHPMRKATSDNFEVSGGNFNKSVPSGYLKDGFVCKKDSATNTYKLVTGATGVTLSESEKTIKVGESFKLEAVLTPEDAELKSVTWKSSDKKIATVTNGVVKGVAIGDVTITATPNAAGATPATCTVHVYDEVAQIGETKYSAFEDALKEAKENDTITLLKDVLQKTTVEISKTLTLDLNGHNITGKNGVYGRRVFHVVGGGNLTLTGTGTITTAAKNDKTFVASSSVIRVGDDTADKSAELTVGSGVTIKAPVSYGISVFGKNTSEKLTVSGTVESATAAAIAGNGSGDMCATTITIEDGAKIVSTGDAAIYHPQAGNLTVKNATITGMTGIEAKSGDTVIAVQNAVVKATAPVSHTKNSNGTSTRGYAIAVVENAAYKGGAKATISDGKYTGPVAIVKDDENVAKPATLTVTGGLFSSDPSTYVPNSHHVEDSGNGSYPFAVKPGAKDDATIIVTAATNAAVSDTIKDEDKTKIEAVKDKANVEGMAAAIRDDKKAAIAKAAGVTDEQLAGKNTIETEIKVKVEAKAADLANSKLTFEVTPEATVKVNGTEQTKKVPVDNSMLNGQSITVKLPLPAGFIPKQILHKFTGGGQEYFINETEGTKRGAKTFKIENGCAVFEITKFSTFELSGTVTYVAPSGGGSGSGSVGSGAHTVTSDLTGTITKVTVDGKTVAPKHYTVSGGNVTFTEAFMKSLSNGTHKVTIETATKIARGTFTVDNGTKPVVSSKTGDAGIALYAGMAIASVMGSGLVLTSRKRKNH